MRKTRERAYTQGCLGAVPSRTFLSLLSLLPRLSDCPEPSSLRARYQIPPVLPDMLPLLPCSSSSRPPSCLLRVVRSFRICWIARFLFSIPFLLILSLSLSFALLPPSSRTISRSGDYGDARTRNRGFSVRESTMEETHEGL